MADFKTHISASTLLGIGYGAAAYAWWNMPLPTSVLAGGLCGVSGMLPDLDSDSGTPLRESMSFAAAVVPMLLLPRLQSTGMAHEWIILISAGIYLAIRFGVAELLKRYTVHRGMFHSLPAAIIAGETAFLLLGDVQVQHRLLKACGVSLGYLCHLLLDELWSFQFVRGRLRLKQSFGTSLKLFSRQWWPNISTFGKLAILTWLVLKDPNWVQKTYAELNGRPAPQTTRGEEELPVRQALREWWDQLRR
jgi:membrane-bound metal-dependent hydrolase YbcI (DUF457 family)